MHEEYTSQALPSKKYRELLGSAICVFNSNNQFIIENILEIDSSNHDWYKLVDLTSGELLEPITKTITKNSDAEISRLFALIISKRNRIVHSFQISQGDNQILRTKARNGDQFDITEDYLLEFITDNAHLSSALHDLRGH